VVRRIARGGLATGKPAYLEIVAWTQAGWDEVATTTVHALALTIDSAQASNLITVFTPPNVAVNGDQD
jgi:hypothetical protein